jgi:hypothetical protein
MSTSLTVREERRTGVESVLSPRDVDVRLTPASIDGDAWVAELVTRRAKALFEADEIVVGGPMWPWLIASARGAHLVID